ncbi:MAG: hypothetical protein WBH31_09850, partial [Promethearchaeia archaeon]
LKKPLSLAKEYSAPESLEYDLSYLLNLMKMKMTPKDGVKFTPVDLMNIKKIEKRIADKKWESRYGIEALREFIDFETTYKEAIDEKLAELEAKVNYITSGVELKQTKKEVFEQSSDNLLLEGVKLPKMAKLEEVEKRDTQDEQLLDEAMTLINEAENEVKSYELSLKKDILIYQNPYDKAISNYEKARNLFKQVGWAEEAHRLLNTINFYKEKKARDGNLREIEKQKLEKAKLEEARAKYIPEQVPFAREQKIIDLEKFKKEKTKDSEAIFNLINKAERLAQEYEVKKKDGILNIVSPFQEIINIYIDAKKRFEAIGWNEQAGQLINSINYYKEKLEADNRLRALETQKLEQEKKKETKRKLETQLAREAEMGAGGFAGDERITCPMCRAVGGNIKTVEYKSKVLSYVGHIPMYAKKHVCKKCGYEF